MNAYRIENARVLRIPPTSVEARVKAAQRIPVQPAAAVRIQYAARSAIIMVGALVLRP